MIQLRPYQAQAVSAIREAYLAGVTRQLIVMATGLGKTIITASVFKLRQGKRMFGLMHREELLAQAADKIKQVAGDVSIGFEKAERTASFEWNTVVLASVQSVGRLNASRLEKFPVDWPATFWIDESHHVPMKSYLNVLNHFGVYGEAPRRDLLVLGTTATPDRLDKLGYDKIFDDVVYRYGLREGIRDGWLADIHAWRIEADLDLSGVKTTAGDFNQKALAEVVEGSNLDQVAATNWVEKCRGKKNLFFAVNKEHAGKVASALETKGARAKVVVDDTPAEERREAIQKFRAGVLDALVNVGIFTEGTDIPEIEVIHILRPTKSRALYTQMIGRGTRKATGKDVMWLFDYGGSAHDVCAIGQIFGLPDKWVMKGQSVLDDAENLQELEAEVGIKSENLTGLAELKLKLKTSRLELIKGAISDAGLPSRLSWLRPIQSTERYVIAWRNETQEGVEKLPEFVRNQAREAIAREDLWGAYERVEVFVNELGAYEAKIFRVLDGRNYQVNLDRDKSLSKLVGRVEKWIEERRGYKLGLLRKDARWAKEPASGKQLEVLRRRGVPNQYLSGEQMTKREASTLMSLPRERLKLLFSEEVSA